MRVQVRDTLADHIVQADETALCLQRCGQHRADPPDAGEERPGQAARQVGQRLVLLARHDKDVALEYRPCVKEAHGGLIGEYQVRRHLAGHHAAERARCHQGTVAFHRWPQTDAGTCWLSEGWGRPARARAAAPRCCSITWPSWPAATLRPSACSARPPAMSRNPCCGCTTRCRRCRPGSATCGCSRCRTSPIRPTCCCHRTSSSSAAAAWLTCWPSGGCTRSRRSCGRPGRQESCWPA